MYQTEQAQSAHINIMSAANFQDDDIDTKEWDVWLMAIFFMKAI